MANEILDKKPEASRIQGENLYTFVYKVGPAPKTGCVRAKDPDEAYRVAVKWCEINGCRAPANVQPMILADATILK